MFKYIKNSFDYLYIFFILLITIITIFSIYYINLSKQRKENSFYVRNISNLEIAYKASMQKYQLLAQNVFDQQVNKPKILELFYKGATSKGDEQALYRGLLYRELYPYYKHLKFLKVLQFHFHLSNSESFLRFHVPNKSGDSLRKSRESVNFVNKTHKSYSGYETGKVISGFRNVFPIKYKNQYIGSVEISLSSRAIVEALFSLDDTKEYALLVNKAKIDSKIFKTQKYLYSISDINSQFLKEDTNPILPNSTKKLSKIASTINMKFHHNEKLHKAMKKAQAYGTFVKIDNAYYEVAFIPLIGLDSTTEGYLVSYQKNINVPLIISRFFYFPFFMILTGGLFILLILLIRNKATTVNAQKKWFNLITETIGDGLYVIDSNSIIEYANPMTTKILGFSHEELIGANSHYLFHSHFINNNLAQKNCPIYTNVIQNNEFYSHEEFFTCKDGKTIPVDISATPTIEDENNQKIVVIFKDIQEKKKAESKMHMLTKALEASTNAIVITDIDGKIEWANPAFETLTNFKIEEVLFHNPKEFLASGKQSQLFYKKMWDTILSKKAWTGELINKKKNGSLYHEELTITPVLDENNEIEHFIAIKQDITERKAMEEEIRHSAFFDSLTSLPNRRLLREHLGKSIHSLARTQKSIAVLFIDIDKFKSLNDTYGHDAGDELLIKIANRLNALMRKEDIVARLGGDEFIIVLSSLPHDKNNALKITKMISEKVRETIKNPFRLNSTTYQTSASIGAYIFNDKNEKVDTILKNADIALYDAKSKGRDIVSFYDS